MNFLWSQLNLLVQVRVRLIAVVAHLMNSQKEIKRFVDIMELSDKEAYCGLQELRVALQYFALKCGKNFVREHLSVVGPLYRLQNRSLQVHDLAGPQSGCRLDFRQVADNILFPVMSFDHVKLKCQERARCCTKFALN